eukprot:CAMPEP_0197181500 /NCGR_PEP_ID=MMETSP1423-20130617/5765_1 /TAXON_ID=476441 /ORGANISM="Pseudo-nitzschia heimii, Strain UNC1101" /LENGTH=399 /DNA_ID=CAMNT_0042631757 /DNA_START=34 /DNA_END=1233 /DNA_ORIENTATION=-
MPFLLWVIVFCAIRSRDQQATGFSALSLGRRISYSRFSNFFEKTTTRDRRYCWYAVNVNREEFVSTVARPEEAKDVGFDTGTKIGTEAEAASVSPPFRKKKRKLSVASRATFETRFGELLEFKELHGHLKVPRRYGKLGDWVNKLRQRKDRLDQDRLDRLNEIDFCWDASGDKRRKEREKWWERLESLPLTTIQQEQTGVCRIPDTAESEDLATTVNEPFSLSLLSSSSSRGVAKNSQQSSMLSFEHLTSAQKKWLRRQQIEYIESGRKPSTKLDKTQIQALNEIDPNWWQTARERKWHAQYLALKYFRAKHGHCNVPNSHEDTKLFHWVQNTRKKYRAVKFGQEDGRRSDGSPILSKAQIELLDKIDFVWDPWGHHTEYSWSSKTSDRFDRNARSRWD